MLLVKYDSDGFEYWRYSHDYIDNQDAAVALCIDSNDDIYLTGGSYSPTEYSDMLTIKVDITGALDWEEVYDFNHLYDLGVKIALSGTRVIVTGVGQLNLTSAKILALSYMQSNGTLSGVSASSTGLEQSIEEVSDLYVDENDNIYIAGSVVNPGYGYDFKLIKLDEDLEEVWVKTWDGEGLNDYARGVKVAPNGDVYLCGTSATSGDGDDMVLIKYNSSGTQQWLETYNGNYRGDDRAETLEYHSDGFIYVAGSSFVVSNMDYLALKYNTSGDLLWEINYNSPYNKNDRATNMAIDSEGDIIVTGQCERDGVLKTYFAVKYVERTVISPQSSEIIPSNAHFTPNVGQVRDTEGDLADDVVFVSRNDYPAIFVQNDKLTYVLSALDTTSIDSLRQDTLHRVDMIFNKSNNNQRFYPLGEKPYLENYYLGHMQQFAERVHPYEQLVSFEVYDDIDVIVSNNSAGLKYYFVCKPGFNLGKLDWSYDGADTVLINNDALEIHTSLGAIIHPQAEAWQIDGNGDVVSLAWQPDYVNSNGNISFSLGSYDVNETLVIAVSKGVASSAMSAAIGNLLWSSYLGGSAGSILADIANDDAGNTFVGGAVYWDDLPVDVGIIIEPYSGTTDAVVFNFNSSIELVWVSYFGGTLGVIEENFQGEDRATSIAVSSNGDRIFIVGLTLSADLPIIGGGAAYTDDEIGCDGNECADAFIARFSSDGFLVWSTYFGDDGDEIFHDVVLDSFNQVYAVGKRNSNTLLQTRTGASNYSTGNGMLVHFNQFNQLLWSNAWECDEIYSVTCDSENNVFYTGKTVSETMPVLNWDTNYPLQQFHASGNRESAFVTKFNSSGVLNYSFYYGGHCRDIGCAIESDGDDNIYMAGHTLPKISFCDVSTNLPVLNGFNISSEEWSETFLVKIAPQILSTDNVEIIGATYYGGGAEDPEGSTQNHRGTRLAVSDDGYAFLIGTTRSSNNIEFFQPGIPFPTNQPVNFYVQEDVASTVAFPNADVFIAAFNPSFNLVWATYFGGEKLEVAKAASVSNSDNRLYVTATCFTNNALIQEGEVNFPIVEYDILGTDDYIQLATVESGIPDVVAMFDISGIGNISSGLLELNPGANNVSIYPNPTTGLITFSSQIDILSIQIFDLNGKVISEFPVNNMYYSINVGHLSQGMYITKILCVNDVFTLKIQKL